MQKRGPAKVTTSAAVTFLSRGNSSHNTYIAKVCSSSAAVAITTTVGHINFKII